MSPSHRPAFPPPSVPDLEQVRVPNVARLAIFTDPVDHTLVPGGKRFLATILADGGRLCEVVPKIWTGG